MLWRLHCKNSQHRRSGGAGDAIRASLLQPSGLRSVAVYVDARFAFDLDWTLRFGKSIAANRSRRCDHLPALRKARRISHRISKKSVSANSSFKPSMGSARAVWPEVSVGCRGQVGQDRERKQEARCQRLGRRSDRRGGPLLPPWAEPHRCPSRRSASMGSMRLDSGGCGRCAGFSLGEVREDRGEHARLGHHRPPLDRPSAARADADVNVVYAPSSTRRRRCLQVIAARASAALGASSALGARARGLPSTPARWRAWGANTP